jgi:hypothetical protein
MAKTDNLKDFLTDVADAIREKKGTTDLINPQDFSAEIASIKSGGGGVVAASPKAVNFRDYDGTILHSYTKGEFLALSAMPGLPTREGLTCQGWNCSFEDAKAYVTDNGRLDVGATYITDDGKTRLYITIAAEGRMNVSLYFQQTIANGVTIDWGDGSATQTLSGTGSVNTTHTYAEIGEYTISLNPSSGCTLRLGQGSSSYCVMGTVGTNGRVYSNMLQAVEVGKNVTSIDTYAFSTCYSLSSIVIPNGVTSIGTYAFSACYSLSSIVIPNGVTNIGAYAFNTCYSLSSIVIPNGVTSIGTNAFNTCYSLSSIVIPNGVTKIGAYAFNTCYSLSSIVIPNGVTSIGTYAFSACYSLSSIVIPNGVTIIGTYAFSTCYSLSSIVIPNGVTKIGNNTFNACYSLSSIVIPNGVTSIDNNAFKTCYGMAYYDFRQCASIPALDGTSVFNGISSDCKIVVPDSLYDTWIAATNWSALTSKIVKASDFNA